MRTTLQKSAKVKTAPDLIKEADRLFSLLIRQDAADENGIVKCCTCNARHHWRRVHCGHFMVRQHQATRYDRKNTGPQCCDCNTFHEGMQYQFSKYLNATYGDGTAEEMLFKSKLACKRGVFDLQYMINEFKEELRRKGYEIR